MSDYPYDPLNWYWTVTDTNPTTHVFSSASGTYVVLADATYVAWLALGNTPTTMDTNVGMYTLMSSIALSLYISGTGYGQTIDLALASNVVLTNPLGSLYIYRTTGANRTITLPAGNLPTSRPLNVPLIIINKDLTYTLQILQPDGITYIANVLPGEVHAVFNSSFSTNSGYLDFLYGLDHSTSTGFRKVRGGLSDLGTWAIPYHDGTNGGETQALALGAASTFLMSNGASLAPSFSAIVPGAISLTSAHLLIGNVSNVAVDVAMSGDATLANTGALTLASTIAAGGPTGSATVTPIITYDAKGRLTAVSSATIAPAATSITGTLGADHGGTGIANNAASTITISGNFATTFTVTAATGVTLPITGTLSTLAGAEELTNKTLNASVGKGTWTASGTWVLPAHTLGGTISGGGNQINNVIIGTTTPLAGTFTVLTGTSGSITGLTALAIRDTTAAFDVTIAATSVPNISAGRTLTIDMGNAANTLSFGAWVAYTPTITATTGAFTTVSANGVFLTFGKLVFFRAQIICTTIGTAAGRLLMTFPTGAPNSNANYALAINGTNQTSHKSVTGQVFDSLTKISVNLYDGTFPLTSGENVNLAGFYELA